MELENDVILFQSQIIHIDYLLNEFLFHQVFHLLVPTIEQEHLILLRDSQCGLFATGKVLRRFQVPFTYLCNCNLDDPEFERGVKNFIAVCNVVKAFRQTRILQIGPRPFDFWSTMCNEGELLEKFNIQLSPIPIPELTAEIKK